MEHFRSGLINQYYRNLDGVIFVYDITKRNSFIDVENWLSEVRQYGPNDGHVKMVLLGNKSDLEDEREVPIEDGREYADKHDMFFVEVSAKNKDCLKTLDATIDRLLEQMLACREENSLTRTMQSVIRLEGHMESDWVMVDERYQGPFSRYDNRRSASMSRQELGESIRRVFNKQQSAGNNRQYRLSLRNTRNKCTC